MKIVEYFTADDKAHWLDEMRQADWGAGEYLATLLAEGRLKSLVGQSALVPMLTDGDRLVAFCTFAPLDDVQPTELTPWVGFVYTFPAYRGRRCAGKLLDWAESIAAIMGREHVYISTNHVGLYEKYGYAFFREERDVHGGMTRVYRKPLLQEDGEKEARLARGAEAKAGIVARAKCGVDMLAVCGFSCAHCFMGEWCGGCRSVFNCCSFGTLFAGGKCPNAACCEEKGLAGCYACGQLENCGKGFYAPGNDGAAACKAQALFVQRHGKEALFRAHDRLHELHDFRKTQEVLGPTVADGLRVLETALRAET